MSFKLPASRYSSIFVAVSLQSLATQTLTETQPINAVSKLFFLMFIDLAALKTGTESMPRVHEAEVYNSPGHHLE